MKKLEKKVDDLLDSLKKDQSAFVMCCNDDGEFFYAYNARSEEIGAGIASVISDWFDDDKEFSQRAAEGVLAGLRAVIKRGGKAGEAVARILGRAAAEKTLDNIMHLRDILKEIAEEEVAEGDGKGDNDDEDCEGCEINRTCSLPSAIKYRKANGIPAPKKRSNKRCNENEKGS